MGSFRRLIAVTLILLVCFVSLGAFAASTVSAAADTDKMKDSVVRVGIYYNGKVLRSGSGFVVGDGKHIVTNWHVVNGMMAGARPCVVLGLNRVVWGKLIGVSPAKDVAILELEQRLDKAAVTFAPRETVKAGETMLTVIGYPGYADIEEVWANNEPSINRGGVSKVTRTDKQVYVYQTDAAVNPGNSGGPAFNENGAVIGIISSGFHMTGVNFAIQAEEIMEELKKANVTYEIASAPAAAKADEKVKKEESKEVKPAEQGISPALMAGGGTVVIILAAAAYLVMRPKAQVTPAGGSGSLPSKPIPVSPKNPPSSPAARQLMPVVVGVSGEFAGSIIEIGAQPLVLGRDPQLAQLVFQANNTDISRTHTIVRYEASSQSFLLEDRSTNGTFLLSGDRLRQGEVRRLKAGERFYLSDPKYMFEVRLENV